LEELMLENSRAKSNSPEAELLKLRSEVGALRAQLADAKNRKGPEQPPLSTAREYFNRATSHNFNHEYEAELDDLNKAIELDPKLAEAYLRRADLYAYQLPKVRGGEEKAMPDFNRCLELDPNNSSARWNRANTFAHLRQYDQSIADWTTYIEGNTDFSHELDGPTKSIASAHFWRGHTYEMYLHDYSKAIADYTIALQMNPKIEDAHRQRGICYEALGEIDKAQQDFAIEPKRQ
jgi:tetratricopeptide (TPR) repeat protein